MEETYMGFVTEGLCIECRKPTFATDEVCTSCRMSRSLYEASDEMIEQEKDYFTGILDCE